MACHGRNVWHGVAGFATGASEHASLIKQLRVMSGAPISDVKVGARAQKPDANNIRTALTCTSACVA
jgi:hypothetical protein